MKERLDLLLVNRGLAPSREKAKAIIMSGVVFVNGQKEDKAGAAFEETAAIEVRGRTLRYVSRGGLKLEKAVERFGLDLRGRICMDVGASTGGFTDCMLQNGAAKVYAVDVGYGQLDWRLRGDSRVVCMEKTNIRYVTADDVPERIQFASIDVSFISLTKVLGPVRELLEDGGRVVCLIKPQFEAGREKVGKKGVVREKSTHLEVIRKVAGFASQIGYEALDLDHSPIRGPEGNIEYLLYLRKAGEAGPQGDEAARSGEESGPDDEAPRSGEMGGPAVEVPQSGETGRSAVEALHSGGRTGPAVEAARSGEMGCSAGEMPQSGKRGCSAVETPQSGEADGPAGADADSAAERSGAIPAPGDRDESCQRVFRMAPLVVEEAHRVLQG